MSTREDRVATLRATLGRLEKATNPFPIDKRHGLPDYALIQFAADVFEQCGATLQVVSGPAPRAAVTNARAAFESSLDMLALVAEPSLYDEMGAYIRVCELISREDLRRLREKASQAGGFPPLEETSLSTEEIVAGEGHQWEADQAGVLQMCSRVLGQVRSDGRWKSHWSGQGNYTALLSYVERKHGAQAGFKEIGAMWYRAVTHESHPGLRTNTRSIEWTPAGRLAVGPKPGDDALPLVVANYACEHAVEALRIRHDLFPATVIKPR